MTKGGKWGTHNNNGRHHSQPRDPERLYMLQHLHEIEFLHDIHGDTALESGGDEDCLGHGVVHWEEAEPLSGGLVSYLQSKHTPVLFPLSPASFASNNEREAKGTGSRGVKTARDRERVKTYPVLFLASYSGCSAA